MKKTLLFCLLVFITAGVFGQSRELSVAFSNYRIERSEYEMVNGTKELRNSEAVSRLFNLSYGYYIPVYCPHPNIGIGVNASIYWGIRYSSDAHHDVFADVGLPVAVALRYGAGSTREAYSPVGVGLGAGYKLNAMVVPLGDPFFVKEDPFILSFFRPCLFAELVFDYQKRDRSFFDNFKIQFAFQPVMNQSNYSSALGEDIDSKMYYYSISFIKFNTLD